MFKVSQSILNYKCLYILIYCYCFSSYVSQTERMIMHLTVLRLKKMEFSVSCLLYKYLFLVFCWLFLVFLFRDEQNVPGTGTTEPVPVPNLPNRVLFRYRLLAFSVPVRYRYLPVFTLKYRYRTVPNRVYSVPVPTFGDFRYRFFRYRTVPSSSLFLFVSLVF
ncbi:hypothetical protein Hanom_Chr04g00306991 [Helianthus anomalus]